MRESIKVICVVVFAAAAIAVAIAWFDDQPDPVTWSIRFGGAVVALLAVAGFLRISRKSRRWCS